MPVDRKRLIRKSVPLGIVAGSGLGVAITLIGAFGIALLLENGTVQEMGEKNTVMLLSALSAFAGSLTAIRMAGKWVLPIALGTGAAYMIIMLCCTALFFGGQYSDVGTRLLAITAGSGCALLTKMRKKSAGSVRKKYRIR